MSDQSWGSCDVPSATWASLPLGSSPDFCPTPPSCCSLPLWPCPGCWVRGRVLRQEVHSGRGLGLEEVTEGVWTWRKAAFGRV